MGGVEELLEAVNKIGQGMLPELDEEPDAGTAALQSGQQGARGPAQPKVAEPSVGSYERFMSTFGSPARWAGRS